MPLNHKVQVVKGVFSKEVQIAFFDDMWDLFDQNDPNVVYSLNNPFENKQCVQKAYLKNFARAHEMFGMMEEIVRSKLANDTSWVVDDTMHFHGVHYAHRGSFLKMHKDANIAPNGLFKKYTVLYYLTRGKPCEGDGDFVVAKDDYSNPVRFTDLNNTMLIVENKETIHGFPEPIESDEFERVVFTFSLLTHDFLGIKQQRKRALFVPRLNESTEELKRLAAMRADPELATEVYRMLAD